MMISKYSVLLKNNEHDSCTSQLKGKVECPTCHKHAKHVLGKTVKALLIDEVKSKLEFFDGFYFCKTASCKTVYFREETFLTQEDIRVVVGLKDGATPDTVCYCFGWTKEKIKLELQGMGESRALEDIKLKMKKNGCS